MSGSIRNTVRNTISAADPRFVFGSITLSLVVLVFGTVYAPLFLHRYIHMVVGIMWTTTNIFIAFIIGPVLRQMDENSQVNFFRQFTPKVVFLLPMLLILAISIGLPLAIQMRLFTHPIPWLALLFFVNVTGILLIFGWRFNAWTDRRWQTPFVLLVLLSLIGVGMTIRQFQMTTTNMTLTLIDGTLLILNGLGLILANNLRVCSELFSNKPNTSIIVGLALQNTVLARVQIFLQLVIIISVL
ncbi:MAG: hypothetical protein ABEI86_09970 [Halobacteriaceae archaeon]